MAEFFGLTFKDGILKGKTMTVPNEGTSISWPPPEIMWVGPLQPITEDVAGAMLYRRSSMSDLTAEQANHPHVMRCAKYETIDPETEEFPEDPDEDPTVLVDFTSGMVVIAHPGKGEKSLVRS